MPGDASQYPSGVLVNPMDDLVGLSPLFLISSPEDFTPRVNPATGAALEWGRARQIPTPAVKPRRLPR